jgi:hypothetical protein
MYTETQSIARAQCPRCPETDEFVAGTAWRKVAVFSERLGENIRIDDDWQNDCCNLATHPYTAAELAALDATAEVTTEEVDITPKHYYRDR